MEIRTSRPGDGVDARLPMTDPDAGCEWVAVAADGDRIVPTATLMDMTLTLAGLDLPAGQVEQVATDVEYEGRGLVRQLMGWAHDRSAERGHLVQAMIGIPYFYRQFGYTYSIPVKQARRLAAKPEPVAGHTIRRATEADVPALARLQDDAQQGADLRMGHTPPCWRWLVDRTGSTAPVRPPGSSNATAGGVPESTAARPGAVPGADPGRAEAVRAPAPRLHATPSGSGLRRRAARLLPHHVRFRRDGTEIGSARTASTGCAAGTPTSSQARTST